MRITSTLTAMAVATGLAVGVAQAGESIPGSAGKLYVDDGGSGGVPVVFIHSFAGDTTHWTEQLKHLRKTRRAIALDLRGHGQSQPPANGDYSIDGLKADVTAVVDTLKLDRFVLVGHSMGGPAAIAYAAANPSKVAGLVLVASAAKAPPEMAKDVIDSLEKDFGTVYAGYADTLLAGAQQDVAAKIRKGMLAVDQKTAMTIIKVLFAHDPLPGLKQYPGPKLAIITSEGDTPMDLHNQTHLPHMAIEDTGHWPQMDKPDEFNRVLEEFLKQHVD
jgi:pimeloyl-ACP methyl ester carboxylesterase